MLVVSFLCNSIYIRLCAESVGGIQWWASESWLLASGAADSAASVVCVATTSMGGLDSAAAAAARLVADAYMAAPADVAAAPATAVGPVSYVVWTCFGPLLWICLNLISMNSTSTCGCRWTKQDFICMCVSNACDAYSDTWNNHYDIYDFLVVPYT